jgi:hypothetical protein
MSSTRQHTYYLSPDTGATIRRFGEVEHVAPTQDAVVEYAVLLLGSAPHIDPLAASPQTPCAGNSGNGTGKNTGKVAPTV